MSLIFWYKALNLLLSFRLWKPMYPKPRCGDVLALFISSRSVHKRCYYAPPNLWVEWRVYVTLPGPLEQNLTVSFSDLYISKLIDQPRLLYLISKLLNALPTVQHHFIINKKNYPPTHGVVKGPLKANTGAIIRSGFCNNVLSEIFSQPLVCD